MRGGGVTSQSAYAQKYSNGYGIRYPEGHIIRFYERICSYELGLKNARVFDFGCGNGTHAKYFMEKGYEVYGVDIIPQAIAQAQQFMGDKARVITPNQRLKGLFLDSNTQDVKFDIVFANQSLYYLDNEHLRICVDELYEMTNQGGICFFTMMSRQNGYAKRITKELDNAMSEVTLEGRLNEQSYINFIGDTQELEAVFAPFKTLYVGEYNAFYLYEPYSLEGSSHHYVFIGKKE